jgi:phage regulatory protein, rha family
MDNLAIINNGQVVVSSRRVAEDFAKQHKDVLENIRDILAAENSATKFFNASTFENRGKQYPEYLMNRDGFSLLVMGFTGKDALQWKLKYIQAFNEMESQLLPKVPQNFAEALRLAANQAEQIEAQKKQLTEAKPKVEFFDAVAGSNDAIEIASVAKVLGIKGMGRNNLFAFLRDKKILMNNNQPYQTYVDRGYFRVLEQKFEKPNGETCINIKTLVYQSGVEFIRRNLQQEERQAS